MDEATKKLVSELISMWKEDADRFMPDLRDFESDMIENHGRHPSLEAWKNEAEDSIEPFVEFLSEDMFFFGEAVEEMNGILDDAEKKAYFIEELGKSMMENFEAGDHDEDGE